MSIDESEPEREGQESEPEPQPATIPDDEPGVTVPEPGTFPEEPDVSVPDPEEERT